MLSFNIIDLKYLAYLIAYYILNCISVTYIISNISCCKKKIYNV